MVMNVLRRIRLWSHMDRAHPHLMRRGKVPWIVLKHRRARGVEPICLKHRRKGLGLGFRAESRLFHPIDGIEEACEAAMGNHLPRIIRRAVGIDNPTARKRRDPLSQIGIGGQNREVDLVHIMQIRAGINPVIVHEPRQRRPMLAPVFQTQPVRLCLINPKCLHHISRHLDVDLIEERHLRRVKRVVEVEDPRVHMCKEGGRHGSRCRRQVRPEQGLPWIGPPPSVSTPNGLRPMAQKRPPQKDAYDLILEAIDVGVYRPGDRLVESELADRFGVSRTPIREALQRLETQSLLTRDGRSLIVASLDHAQTAELYAVRTELEGLAARLAAKHAAEEEIRVLREMVEADRALIDDPPALSRANRRFHKQIHLASHNRYLVQQLDLVHRSMALMATTSLAATGRGEDALAEHAAIVEAIARRDGDTAAKALRDHLSIAFEVRLKEEAGRE